MQQCSFADVACYAWEAENWVVSNIKCSWNEDRENSQTWEQLYLKVRLFCVQEQLIVGQGNDADMQLTPRDQADEALWQEMK